MSKKRFAPPPRGRTSPPNRQSPALASDGYATAVQHYFAGRYDQARLVLDGYLAENSSAFAGWNLCAVLASIGRDPAKAEAAYRQALGINPDYAEANSNLGNLLLEQKRYEEAEVAYRQALRIKPDSADASYNLGLLLQEQKRYEEAEAAYRQALRINPDFAEASSNLGSLLQKQKRHEEAEAAYRQALRIKPDHAEASSNLGILLEGQKRYEEAEAAYRQALRVKPDFAEANSNLGLLLKAQKRYEEAEAAYRQALRLKPDYAEANSNLGLLLQEQKRYEEAEAAYRQALRIKPDYAEANYNLGNLLQEQKRYEEAEAAYRQALRIKPDYADANSNLGNLLKEQKRHEEAETAYRQALRIKPDLAEACSNLGTLLQGQKRYEEAEAAYRQALRIKPDFAEAHNNLAMLLMIQGERVAALNNILLSLQIEEKQKTKLLFVNCVSRMRSSTEVKGVVGLIIRALSEPWGRPGLTAPAGIGLVKDDQHLAPCLARAVAAWPQRLPAHLLFNPGDLASTATNRLLGTLLNGVPICDIDLERFLTMTRHTLLEAATEAATDGEIEEGVLDFYCALATQCFINEYVFAWTDDEVARSSGLRESMVKALEAGTEIPILWLVAVAAYFPLHALPLAPRLLDRSWPASVADVLVQQLREPEQERQLRLTIPPLTPIEDEVSLLVQEQYEANPYPRWIRVAPSADTPAAIDDHIRSMYPLVTFQPLGKDSDLDILVAGCGTGQHSIGTAQQLRGRVLAIDLSLASLCYAKRKTQEMGLTNIEYAQADILKLGSLGRTFDVIESSGVLHHLADPWEGWRVLLSLLRPGGFMGIGLYSEVARREVVRIRDFIAKRGYNATAGSIRQVRQEMIDSGNNNVIKWNDFFSTSECRDLLFHVQEHRMTLTGIQEFLLSNGLQFLGFNVRAEILHAYQQCFPDDRGAINLDCWQTFENDNPDTFVGMYQFWVQKADHH